MNTVRKLDPVHARIEAEATEMWALLARTGVPASNDLFPDVVALYYAAKNHMLACQATRERYPKSFMYRGKAYLLETTNAGRLRVLNDAGRLLVNGGPFALWSGHLDSAPQTQ